MNQRPIETYADDEIDLFELWNNLWEQKGLISIVMFLTTALGLGYALLSTPVYKGSVVVQVQQVQFKDSEQSKGYFSIEPENTTVRIINAMSPAQLSAEKKVGGVLVISKKSVNKGEIKYQIKETYQMIVQRYSKIFNALKENGAIEVLPVQMIGDISVSNKPIKPKKTLIVAVAMVLGLMLGVFIALIRSAVRNRQALKPETTTL